MCFFRREIRVPCFIINVSISIYNSLINTYKENKKIVGNTGETTSCNGLEMLLVVYQNLQSLYSNKLKRLILNE
jgi:hypothetical protein